VLENGFRAVVLGFARTFQDRLELADPQLASIQSVMSATSAPRSSINFRSQKPIRFYADSVGLSPVHLTRLTRAILGMTPLEAVAARRLHRSATAAALHPVRNTRSGSPAWLQRCQLFQPLLQEADRSVTTALPQAINAVTRRLAMARQPANCSSC
jgi:hypothetical protein